MKVTIVHYHLKAGGVTRVIERQLAAMASLPEPPSVMLLTGDSGEVVLPSSLSVDIIVDERFNYHHCAEMGGDELERGVRELFERLVELASDSVLHVHNHGLGKNAMLTAAIAEYIRQGKPAILHCHDFAEDRPVMKANLEALLLRTSLFKTFNALLYPDFDNCCYLTANRPDADRAALRALRQARVLYLPNPVELHTTPADRETIAEKLAISSSKEWVLYPVRAIERKNIGELILLALLFPHFEWLVTAAPENRDERELYDRWVSVAQKLGAPVRFDSASQVSFEELYGCSDRIITTSYREGFGMAFLEPWLADKIVVGRDISMVTTDMRMAGISFPYLYKTLRVPVGKGVKDFAKLSNKNKFATVEALVNSDLRNSIFLLNPQLTELFAPVFTALADANKAVVEKQFSLTAFADKLFRLYKKLEADRD